MEKVTVRFLGRFTEFLNEKGVCINKDQPIRAMKERLGLRQSPETLFCSSLGHHKRPPTGARPSHFACNKADWRQNETNNFQK
jgi:hypothetical protein